MARKTARVWLLLGALAVFALAAAATAHAEAAQEWELVIPTGVIEQAQIDPAPRPTTLDGKTVVLRWNSKNNGDIFLDRVAELFAQKYPKTKVVKIYNPDTLSTTNLSGSMGESQRQAQAIKKLGADLVIASQAD